VSEQSESTVHSAFTVVVVDCVVVVEETVADVVVEASVVVVGILVVEVSVEVVVVVVVSGCGFIELERTSRSMIIIMAPKVNDMKISMYTAGFGRPALRPTDSASARRPCFLAVSPSESRAFSGSSFCGSTTFSVSVLSAPSWPEASGSTSVCPYCSMNLFLLFSLICFMNSSSTGKVPPE
jgi:hypothetical protein